MTVSEPELNSYDRVLKLVEQLPPDEQEQLRLRLNSKWVFSSKNEAMDQLRKEAFQGPQARTAFGQPPRKKSV